MPVFIGRDAFSQEKHCGTFRRNHEGDYHCDKEEIRAMYRDGADTPLDAKVLTNHSADELSQPTITAYRQYFRRIRPNHPWNSLNDSDFLLRLRAIARSNNEATCHPTVAGLLMFGEEYAITKEFPQYSLDYREEITGNRWDDRVFSVDGTWSGNLYDFWQIVYAKLREAVPHPFRLNGDARRVDDNPMDAAVREALTNTLVHADYNGRRGTAIIRRPEILEFTNPGRLRVTKAEAEQGGISDTRNPTLMKMFILANIGEKAGSGFDTMRAGCDFAGTPYPILEESSHPDQVKLKLQYTVSTADQATLKPQATGEPPQQATGSLSNSEATALRYLHEHRSTSTPELAEHLEVGPSRARAVLKALVDNGLARKLGNGRSTRYEIV